MCHKNMIPTSGLMTTLLSFVLPPSTHLHVVCCCITLRWKQRCQLLADLIIQHYAYASLMHAVWSVEWSRTSNPILLWSFRKIGRDDWNLETWHRETGQRGTISQGWTSRDLFQCSSRCSLTILSLIRGVLYELFIGCMLLFYFFLFQFFLRPTF